MTTAFEQTWQQDNNRVPSDQTTVALQSKSMLWYIKAFLKGEIGGAAQGLWTCAGSSDASSAGMDASDRWTSSFDATKLTRASGAVAHSWIVLQSPAGLGDGPWYMLLDWNTSNDYQVNLYFSKTAFTGGSVTARPTSAVEWSNTSQQFTNASITAAHMFGLLSSDGDFHVKFGQDSSAVFTFALSFFALTETKTGDAHNGWSYVEYSVSGGVWQLSNLNVTSSAKVKGRNKDNTAAVTASMTAEIVTAGTYAMTDVGTADATDSAYNDAPIRLQVDTVAHKSRRGRLRDIMWAPTAAAVGLVEPAAGPSYTSTVVGDTWHPYDAAVIPSL